MGQFALLDRQSGLKQYTLFPNSPIFLLLSKRDNYGLLHLLYVQ